MFLFILGVTVYAERDVTDTRHGLQEKVGSAEQRYVSSLQPVEGFHRVFTQRRTVGMDVTSLDAVIIN